MKKFYPLVVDGRAGWRWIVEVLCMESGRLATQRISGWSAGPKSRAMAAAEHAEEVLLGANKLRSWKRKADPYGFENRLAAARGS